MVVSGIDAGQATPFALGVSLAVISLVLVRTRTEIRARRMQALLARERLA